MIASFKLITVTKCPLRERYKFTSLSYLAPVFIRAARAQGTNGDSYPPHGVCANVPLLWVDMPFWVRATDARTLHALASTDVPAPSWMGATA